jgi:hypothetical protein
LRAADLREAGQRDMLCLGDVRSRCLRDRRQARERLRSVRQLDLLDEPELLHVGVGCNLRRPRYVAVRQDVRKVELGLRSGGA